MRQSRLERIGPIAAACTLLAGPATKVFPQDEHWSMPGSELTHLHELTISAITKEKTKAKTGHS